jgi:hypothetical protein
MRAGGLRVWGLFGNLNRAGGPKESWGVAGLGLTWKETTKMCKILDRFCGEKKLTIFYLNLDELGLAMLKMGIRSGSVFFAGSGSDQTQDAKWHK